MKNKKLFRVLGSASVIALILAALIFTPAYFNSTSEYADRGKKEKYGEKEEYKGIAGAMQYYWERQRNIKTGKIEISDILRADRAVEAFAKSQSKSSAALNLSWEEMGPDNVGGRTRAILFDKDDPQKMYAGAVSGGLWRSITGGITWVKATTQLNPKDNLAVSCITQAANGDIYFGTGESFTGANGQGKLSTPGAIGKGIWKSTDGINFDRLPSTVPTDTNSSGIAWAFVNRLAADPVNADKIYAATNTRLWISYNGGVDWSIARYCIDPPLCGNMLPMSAISDVKVGSDGSVFASASGTIYYSATGDTDSFIGIKTNFPDNLNGASRIELAIAPSDPNYIYCAAAEGAGELLNIYQSKDKGQTWAIIGPGGSSFNPHRTQGRYNNALAVFPDDPEHILIGGVELWEWSHGARAMIAITTDFQGSGLYVHADVHTFAFHPDYDGVTNNTFFIGTDGGLFRSIDGGSTFQEMSKNYITCQFYAIGFSRDGAVAGGTQDNGNPYIDGTGNTPLSETYNLPSGDGGYMQFSTIMPDAFFWESQNGSANRSPSRGAGSSRFFPGNWTCNSDPVADVFVNDGGAWVTPFLLWESFNDLNSNDSVEFAANKIDPATGNIIFNTYPAGDTIAMESNNDEYPFNYVIPSTINPGDTLMIQDIVQSKFFVGLSSGVWMAKDVLDFSEDPEWYKISTTTGVTTMAYSNDGDVLFIGMGYSGQVIRISGILSIKPGDLSTDICAPLPCGDKNPCNSVSISVHPSIQSTAILIPGSGGQIVTGIAVDPNDANNVVLTLGNYGGTFSHVFRSTDALGAANFTSISSATPTNQNYLPQMPVYDAVIDKTDPNRIIIGTEYGIYGTENGFDPVPGNVVWAEENTGMARVPTYMVSQQRFNNNTCTGVINSGVIYIGTHGRGIFKCGTFADPQAVPPSICNVGEITGIDKTLTGFNNLSGLKVYPNPLLNEKGNISFNLDKGTDVTIKIFDLRGRVIETIDMGKQTAGVHKVTFDSNGLSAGTYFVSLTAGEFRKAAKFVVITTN